MDGSFFHFQTHSEHTTYIGFKRAGSTVSIEMDNHPFDFVICYLNDGPVETADIEGTCPSAA